MRQSVGGIPKLLSPPSPLSPKGSTVDRISVEEFPNYTIPVISLKNQKKMVAVLEKIDAKIRTNNKINDYLSYQSSMAA